MTKQKANHSKQNANHAKNKVIYFYPNNKTETREMEEVILSQNLKYERAITTNTCIRSQPNSANQLLISSSNVRNIQNCKSEQQSNLNLKTKRKHIKRKFFIYPNQKTETREMKKWRNLILSILCEESFYRLPLQQ